MSLSGSTSKRCVALGFGNCGSGGGSALTTGGGGGGVGRNSEQPADGHHADASRADPGG